MLKSVVFNGKTVPVYHAEAGGIHRAKRIEVPGCIECYPENVWDRKYSLLTDVLAIEVTIELAEVVEKTCAEIGESKYLRHARILQEWEEQTSVGKIREIELTGLIARCGRVVFETGAWPAVWISTRDLNKEERLIVVSLSPAWGSQQADKSSAPSDWMSRKETQEYCKISKATLTNWMRDGLIRFRKQGRKVLFNRIEVGEDLKKFKK